MASCSPSATVPYRWKSTRSEEAPSAWVTVMLYSPRSTSTAPSASTSAVRIRAAQRRRQRLLQVLLRQRGDLLGTWKEKVRQQALDGHDAQHEAGNRQLSQPAAAALRGFGGRFRTRLRCGHCFFTSESGYDRRGARTPHPPGVSAWPSQPTLPTRVSTARDGLHLENIGHGLRTGLWSAVTCHRFGISLPPREPGRTSDWWAIASRLIPRQRGRLPPIPG